MNAKPSMVKPQYKISLTMEQTLELGRFCVIWGQIDHCLMLSVSKLIAVDLTAGLVILGDMTTGPLVNLLNKNRSRIKDREIKKLTKEFCDDMGGLIEFRNHLMHGIWGWWLPGKKAKKAKPACHFSKNPHNPVFPDEITAKANEVAELTFKINRIFCHLHGTEMSKDEGKKFFFGQHYPNTPKGMQLRVLI
ncbi:MAG: hypothetical protein HQ494_03540 [Rhodospirillales bacterium]|nr:hypothetical protein [Rhodospirillales bacterium]